MADESDLLSRLAGDCIGGALATLPSAATATVDTMEAEISLPEWGKLRITCKRMCQQRGKSRHWFWTAEKAVRVG